MHPPLIPTLLLLAVFVPIQTFGKTIRGDEKKFDTITNKLPRNLQEDYQPPSQQCIAAVINAATGGNPSHGIRTDGCDVFLLYEQIDQVVLNLAECQEHFPEEILATMLGLSVAQLIEQEDEGESFERAIAGAIAPICARAKADFDSRNIRSFYDMNTESMPWFHSFYDGGTILNEHVDNDAGTTMLQDEGAFIETFYQNVVLNGPITFPNNLKNFQNCENDLEAVMCCWVQDRQEDDNGNCAGETYRENCHNADPDANTEVCHVDLSNAPPSSRVKGGFSIYGPEEEGETHCHGFAWTGNASDDITRYRGNNLFFVSFYDHLFVRGYVRQVPGAAMCGCMKQLPVVTRSDCTQVDVLETFRFNYDAMTGLSGRITNALVEFNSCEAEEEDNDLGAYWREINQGNSQAQSKIDKYLVGEDNCPAATGQFLASQMAKFRISG